MVRFCVCGDEQSYSLRNPGVACKPASKLLQVVPDQRYAALQQALNAWVACRIIVLTH